MTAMLGVFGLGVFFLAVSVGEARGLEMAIWGMFSAAIFVPFAGYVIVREANRTYLDGEEALAQTNQN